ncbi:MAG: hypothetical protein LBC86_04920 [Oscillospiraceae bacterium]|jgi:hypothetical protein|nr:hypothetical protein [Oscillospiraceae bacterium]
MKKVKKAIVIFIILISVVSSTACSSDFTGAEKFAARANITLMQGMWDFPELEGVTDYVFTSIEYYVSGAARVIRANCAVSKSGDIVPYVFLLSDREEYLNDFISNNTEDDFFMRPRYLEETELYYINLFDFEFTVNEENSVSILNVMDLTALYLRSGGNKSLFGMN